MTAIAPLTRDEPARLAALRALNLLDTPREERFDRITRLARFAFGTRYAAISLVSAERQWFKAADGIDLCESPRELAFCAHALHESAVLVVEDARSDPRFRDNPLVTGEPHLAFYAGALVRADDGSAVGTVCVLDDEPRRFSGEERERLAAFARLVENEIRMGLAPPAFDPHALTEAMRRREMVDPATRVWNRDAILEELARAWANRATPWAAIMIDVNPGVDPEATGEGAWWQELGRRLVAAVGERGAVGRMSHREFLAVIAPCAVAADAVAVQRGLYERLEGFEGVGSGLLGRVSTGCRFVDANAVVSMAQVLSESDGAMCRDRVERQRGAA